MLRSPDVVALALVVAVGLGLSGCGGSTEFSTGGDRGPGATGQVAQPTIRGERAAHTATVLPNGNVLIVGGADRGGLPVTQSEVYVRLGMFFSATGGNLLVPRARHTATRLRGGKVLLTGGQNQTTVFASTELYDEGSDRFTAGPVMVGERTLHTATLTHLDSVLLIGGLDQGGQPVGPIGVVAPDASAITAGQSLLIPRSRHAAVFAPTEDEVFVFGGEVAGGGVTASVEIVDGNGNVRAARSTLFVARRDPAAIALPDGRILVVGGTDAGGAALTDAEIYDPRNERTVPLRGGLALARAFPVVAPLDGGRVLVTGGGNTTEIFETTDSSFSAGASFGFARDDHTLTRLTADLLIFGGAGVANPAELFFD